MIWVVFPLLEKYVSCEACLPKRDTGWSYNCSVLFDNNCWISCTLQPEILGLHDSSTEKSGSHILVLVPALPQTTALQATASRHR